MAMKKNDAHGVATVQSDPGAFGRPERPELAVEQADESSPVSTRMEVAAMNAWRKQVWAMVAFVSFSLQAQEPPPALRPVAGFHSVKVAGNRTLRYKCEGIGEPTVIVEAALGVSVEATFARQQPVGWAVIAPKIATITQTCVYDRAGLGLSSALTAAETSREAARDLHGMLGVLHIRPPYVLAAHSLGGMDALMFAYLYPESVAGMVLVDSAHPEQQSRFAKVLPRRGSDESDLLKGFRDGPAGPVNGEWFDFLRNTREMQHLPSLGDKPLIVLTRDPNSTAASGLVPNEWEQSIEPVWQELQRQIAALSTNSKHFVVPHAGHAIQYEQPEVVIEAITDVVNQVRSK